MTQSNNNNENLMMYICPFCNNYVNFSPYSPCSNLTTSRIIPPTPPPPLLLQSHSYLNKKKNRKFKSHRKRGHFKSRKTWFKHMMKYHNYIDNVCPSPLCCLEFKEKEDLFNHMILSHYPSLFIPIKTTTPTTMISKPKQSSKSIITTSLSTTPPKKSTTNTMMINNYNVS